jgi:hypothetical protein
MAPILETFCMDVKCPESGYTVSPVYCDTQS